MRGTSADFPTRRLIDGTCLQTFFPARCFGDRNLLFVRSVKNRKINRKYKNGILRLTSEKRLSAESISNRNQFYIDIVFLRPNLSWVDIQTNVNTTFLRKRDFPEYEKHNTTDRKFCLFFSISLRSIYPKVKRY